MKRDDGKTAVFDARWIKREPSGIGVYAEALATRLPRLLPDWKFVFLLRSDASDALESRLAAAAAPGGGGIVRCRKGPLSPSGAIALARFLRRSRAAVYHTPNFMIPTFGLFGWSGRIFATIHDLIPLVVPDYAPHSRTSRMKGAYKRCLRSTALAADTLFTVSETSRRDIVRELSLPEKAAKRVVAVHNGVAAGFFAAGLAPGKKARAGGDERVLLYVGRRDPYKNVPLLVEAFAALRARAPWPVRLVLAGSPDPRYREPEELARALGVADAVSSTGPLGGDDLVALYRSADLLVHPSRYEGFGLQIAEAFASGLPVVCSDGGSIPEIAGDAARIVPLPADAATWARAILDTLEDEAALAALRKAGLARAPLFSWDRAAAAIAQEYLSPAQDR
ncbi:MAG: glycosyltransferase family 4 protein [Kiritimatiellae bacterium]|nr:glycosyltransferase family 4 protein [Kiritimatiellia bacterium]